MTMTRWDDPEVALSVQKTVIEQLRLGEMQSIAESVNVEIARDHLVGGFVAHLEALVMTEHLLCEEQEVSYSVAVPTTSWQLFKHEHKDSWWLGWVVRRHPVQEKMTKHTEHFSFTRYAMFPHSAISMPYMGDHIIVEQTDLPNARERARLYS